ncbi:MAG: TetR/AcrR family transcriptional regulator [Gammaproteobacteria bacterium]
MSSQSSTRAYHSPRRREQAEATRLAILAAAQRLFERNGYAGTSVTAIAKEAKVTPRTVYLGFATKAGVLRAVWNRALRGERDAAPVAAQQWFQEVLEEPDPGRTLRLNARNSRRFKERSTGLLQAVRDAAPLETEIAALWERIQTEYHQNQLAVVESLGPGALRRGLTVTRAADIIWTLNHPNTWIQLRVLRGWTPVHYERWVGDTSCQQLLAPPQPG